MDTRAVQYLNIILFRIRQNAGEKHENAMLVLLLVVQELISIEYISTGTLSTQVRMG